MQPLPAFAEVITHLVEGAVPGELDLLVAGPRMVGVVAALCWGGGFIIGGFGIMTHQLWLVYLGYGVLGGCGLGLAPLSARSRAGRRSI